MLVLSKNNVTQSRSWAGPRDGRQGTSRSSRSPSLRGQTLKSRARSRSFASRRSPWVWLALLSSPSSPSLPPTWHPRRPEARTSPRSPCASRPLLGPLAPTGMLAPRPTSAAALSSRRRAPTSLPHGPPALPSSGVPGGAGPVKPRPRISFCPGFLVGHVRTMTRGRWPRPAAELEGRQGRGSSKQRRDALRAQQHPPAPVTHATSFRPGGTDGE